METDAADGNRLRTRIPTAAWKAQNAFHSSHKARRRLHHRIHFSLGRRMGSTSNIKQQVCQFQTVSTEGFTPEVCAVGSENSEPLIPKILSRSALEGEASSKLR